MAEKKALKEYWAKNALKVMDNAAQVFDKSCVDLVKVVDDVI